MRNASVYTLVSVVLATVPNISCTANPGSGGEAQDAASMSADATGAQSDASSEADAYAGSTSVLNVFNVIHLHLSDDRLPYNSKLMKDGDLDSAKADNMLAIVAGIKGVADKHGLKIAWQPTVGPARGFCQHQGSNHLFKQLLAEGHELGIHAHNAADLGPVYGYLKDNCALTADEITSASGYEVIVDGTTGVQRAASFSTLVQQFSGWSITTGTSNLAPASDGSHDMEPVCKETWGSTSDSWKTTGNVIYPWKPDVKNAIPCNHDLGGSFVMVDHADPQWMLTGGSKVSPLTSTEFAKLQVSFDGAVDYVATHPSDHVAAWGFVTHITEYTKLGNGNSGPEKSALDALDAFLTYVDSKRAEGLVVYRSPASIAQLAYP